MSIIKHFCVCFKKFFSVCVFFFIFGIVVILETEKYTDDVREL